VNSNCELFFDINHRNNMLNYYITFLKHFYTLNSLFLGLVNYYVWYQLVYYHCLVMIIVLNWIRYTLLITMNC